MKGLYKNQKGITLVALIVTIIVLLILAGISLGNLAINNGILGQTNNAKEKTAIQEEKENLKLAAVKAMGANKYGNLLKSGIEKQLESTQKDYPTEANQAEGDKSIYVTYLDTGRIYEVKAGGEIELIGTEEELSNSAIIKASPEKNLTPQVVQFVDLNIITLVEVEDDLLFLKYAWTKDENEEPTEYTSTTYYGNKKNRNTTIATIDGEEGNYYLWVKVELEEKTVIKKYGPYAVKENTKILCCADEEEDYMPFLRHPTITRDKIEKVSFANSISGHSLADANCWDVSENNNGKVLAWYEDSDNDELYEVTVGQEGGVIANPDSSYFLAYIGRYGDDDKVIDGLQNLDTSLVNTTYGMFAFSGVKRLDLSTLDTRNLTTMEAMFYTCPNLTDVYFGRKGKTKFNTSKVTNFAGLFYKCDKLENANVEVFDTKNAETLQTVFYLCNALKQADVGEWNTSKVTNMSATFRECTSLETLDTSKWDTKNVISMDGTFRECSSLKELDVSKWKTDKVQTMKYLFYKCKYLTTIDVSNWNTENVENMSGIFRSCSRLENIDVSGWNTRKVTTTSTMFYACSTLEYIDVDSFDMSKNTDISYMFSDSGKIKTLDVSLWDTSLVNDMSGVFRNCRQLEGADVGNWQTGNVTSFNRMFRDCLKIPELDLANWDVRKVTDATGIFMYIYLPELDLSGWKTESLTTTDLLFFDFSTDIMKLNKFDFSNVTSYGSMFQSVNVATPIVTNANAAAWLNEHFPSYTNITIVNE